MLYIIFVVSKMNKLFIFLLSSNIFDNFSIYLIVFLNIWRGYKRSLPKSDSRVFAKVGVLVIKNYSDRGGKNGEEEVIGLDIKISKPE